MRGQCCTLSILRSWKLPLCHNDTIVHALGCIIILQREGHNTPKKRERYCIHIRHLKFSTFQNRDKYASNALVAAYRYRFTAILSPLKCTATLSSTWYSSAKIGIKS